MSTQPAPSGSSNPIVERMVGQTGEPGQIAATARAAAQRAIPAFANALNARLSWPVEIEIANVSVIRFAEAKPTPEDNCALVVAAAPTSPDALMLLFDPAGVSLVLAALLGADADLPVPAIDRPLSMIERDVAGFVFADFVQAFAGSGARSFDFRLPLPAPLGGGDLRKLVVRDGPAVRIDFSVCAAAGRGRFSAVMPQRVLMAHRGDAQTGEAGQGDEWSTRFGEEILRSTVRLDATIRLQSMTLGDLAGLQAGQVIEFPEGAAETAHLSARNAPLFVCEFGKLGQNYTVRVRQAFDAGQDFIEGIISL
jgi:flagellar motor switch protein FliM